MIKIEIESCLGGGWGEGRESVGVCVGGGGGGGGRRIGARSVDFFNAELFPEKYRGGRGREGGIPNATLSPPNWLLR